MSDHIDVVYIGEKAAKRQYVFGRTIVLPRLKPVSLDHESAYYLLQFTGVFATPDEVEASIKTQEESLAESEKVRLTLAEQAKIKSAKDTFIVYVGGYEKDISKNTSQTLRNIITIEGLNVNADGVKPADLRIAVRDALHEKNGNPLLQ